MTTVSILKRGEPQANKEKTILRDAGLISESSKASSTKDEEHLKYKQSLDHHHSSHWCTKPHV